jgi:hypothetical protein
VERGGELKKKEKRKERKRRETTQSAQIGQSRRGIKKNT